MYRTRGARGSVSSEEGASAVEFALVWFALALFIIGTIQFGIVFNQWLQLEHSAREGARWAALRNPAAMVRSKVSEAAPGLHLGAGDVSISPGDPTAAIPNTSITVTVRHGAPVITPIAENWFGTQVQMSATATQRVE